MTTTLKVGTGIALVTERDPILMAKQAASLDYLSGGRLLLGAGAGWNAEEMAHHGPAYADRWKVLRERILSMRAIWTQEEAEYHGDFVDFEKLWSYPKPKQVGGSPILLGASSKYVYKRIAEYCDGWFPIYQNPARAAAQSRGCADRDASGPVPLGDHPCHRCESFRGLARPASRRGTGTDRSRCVFPWGQASFLIAIAENRAWVRLLHLFPTALA